MKIFEKQKERDDKSIFFLINQVFFPNVLVLQKMHIISLIHI